MPLHLPENSPLRTLKDTRIGIIGLGYVGLPLAVEFGKHYPTVGFDIKAGRIAELQSGKDSTLETTSEELAPSISRSRRTRASSRSATRSSSRFRRRSGRTTDRCCRRSKARAKPSAAF
jgi:UDP-N-acetyl-D-mannosaminuronate dehydrogenase